MAFLLSLAARIDRLNAWVGRLAVWAVLLACLISAGNVSLDFLFETSNAWLEIQWDLFAGIVLLGAAHTLKLNEHVRVDVLYGRMKPRTQAWVDLLGMIFFLMPTCVAVAWMSWPFFLESFASGEIPSAGGLIRWPVRLLIPLGFFLLSLQGVSEIIKRVGYLLGRYNMDTHYERPLQ